MKKVCLGWVVACFLLLGLRAESLDLTGNWGFAMDPLDRGETVGWTQPEHGWTGAKPHPAGGWDTVTVPHDFLSDPRYAFTGVAWYRRSFFESAESAAGGVWRLQFAQVSQRCRVWLNGTLVGTHEGGYTPFEFVVTPLPGRQNLLVVAVDNRIRLRALPGARSGATPNAQLFPWLNYGGILGGVRLEHVPAVYLVDERIEAVPGAAPETAVALIRARVRNTTSAPVTTHLTVEVGSHGRAEQDVSLAAQTEQEVALRVDLRDVARWTVDAPRVYEVKTTIGGRVTTETFGIRSLTIRGGRFLLNDQPVRYAGANRARGHPKFGGLDPDEAVAQDLGMMKAAGLRLARLQHTPPQRNLLEWADRNGMLLILEMGVWGYPAEDLASEELRTRFRAEMRELVTLAANHPSVVGWSVGNEYESWTPEGIAWTRDMVAYLKSLDATRPVTFAALGTALRKLRDGGAAGPHAFDFVDFISTNLYFSPADMASYLDPVHGRWPDKPVLITEFGLRVDKVKLEQERLDHFDRVLALVRARPWVCGLSFWSFNDYASHYPGSGSDGYRRWGLVDEFRRPRALYEHVRTTLGGHGLDATP